MNSSASISLDEDRPNTWQTTPNTQKDGSPSQPWGTVTLAVVAGGVVVWLLGSALRPPSEPRCEPAARWLEVITEQEKQGEWKIAASNARAALSNAELCEQNQSTLAGKAVINDLHGLSATPIYAADLSAQKAAVDDYEGIKRFASEHGVPLPKTPYKVAEDANNAGQFLLARVALDEAATRGDLRPSNQSQVRVYYSTLFNLGWWWTRDRKGPTFGEGLGLLVAADQIDQEYRLRDGLARAELAELLQTNEPKPAPVNTPLLRNSSAN